MKATAMTDYLVSLLMGLAVGAAYGVLHVRSPAPPLVALIGLLGMVLGEQSVELAKRCFANPPSLASMADPPRDDRQA
jgi:XapX domain-containing protein